MFHQVVMQRLKALLRDRYLLPFITLTMDKQDTQVSINIAQAQARQFTTTYARVYKNTHHRPISCSHRLAHLWIIPAISFTCSKQTFNLIGRECRYKFLLHTRKLKMRGYRLFYSFLSLQPVTERRKTTPVALYAGIAEFPTTMLRRFLLHVGNPPAQMNNAQLINKRDMMR